jgi:rod shape-determining protein MreD
LSWIVFLVMTWVAFGLELGLRDALRLAPGDIAPSFVVPLMVFVALSAPPKQAVWAALILGVLLDLTSLVPRTDAASMLTVLGPNAIGMLIAAQFVVAVRGMVIRRHPLTLTVLSIAAAAVVQTVVVAFFTVRDLYGDPILFRPTGELVSRLLSALYTGATAFAWALLLRPVDALFRFQGERGGRRH